MKGLKFVVVFTMRETFILCLLFAKHVAISAFSRCCLAFNIISKEHEVTDFSNIKCKR